MSKKKAKKAQKQAKKPLSPSNAGDDMDKLFEDGGQSVNVVPQHRDNVVPMNKVLETIDKKKRTPTRPVAGAKKGKSNTPAKEKLLAEVKATTKVKPSIGGLIDEATVNADWDTMGTVPELEKKLIGFKFNGPGWYNYRMDVVLVVPMERTIDNWWGQTANDSEMFRAYVYNNDFSDIHPSRMYHSIGSAPTRTM